jgi:hypothetical protein
MSAQVNGDVPTTAPSSAFLQHLMRYPVIHDGVSTFKENPYGQKSLQLGDSAYKTFAKPVVPYFARPYEYVSPYVKKADSIGDQTLAKIEEKFPVVKKLIGELYTEAKGLVFFPLRKGLEGKDHVVKTYSDECTKSGEAGIVTYGKALVTTAFILGNETVSWVSGFLSAKKQEAKTAANN